TTAQASTPTVRPAPPYACFAAARPCHLRCPAPPPIYPLSLHDALPILARSPFLPAGRDPPAVLILSPPYQTRRKSATSFAKQKRSEEHTSELQSRFDLVCRLLRAKEHTDAEIARTHRHRGADHAGQLAR